MTGMSRIAGFFTFDGLLTSKHKKTGHTPSVKISDFDVKVTFCHYKPKECGKSLDFNNIKSLYLNDNMNYLRCLFERKLRACLSSLVFDGHVVRDLDICVIQE